jgi:hypothetical protein
VFSVTNGPANQTDPAVCGSLVVWSDTDNNSDVHAKNLAGGSEIAVAASAAVEAYPACDAGRVVYSYAPLGESSTIRLFNIGIQRIIKSLFKSFLKLNFTIFISLPELTHHIAVTQIYPRSLGICCSRIS